jgi:hypothetical protein
MTTRALLLLSGLVAACLDASAASGIYRCTAPGGAVTYQEVQCPATSEGQATHLPTSFPEVDNAARERLLRRADEAEWRLMRRLEIESAERIAKAEQASRERIAMIEAQAQKDRADAVPVLVGVRRPFAVNWPHDRRPNPRAPRRPSPFGS